MEGRQRGERADQFINAGCVTHGSSGAANSIRGAEGRDVLFMIQYDPDNWMAHLIMMTTVL